MRSEIVELLIRLKNNIKGTLAEEDLSSLYEEGFLSEFSSLESVKVKKGTYLVNRGDITKDLYFVTKGVLRSFSYSDGSEYTIWFHLKGDLVTDLRSFYYNQPGNHGVQAIKDSEVICISERWLRGLKERFPEQFQKIYNLLITDHTFQLKEILMIYQTLDAKSKYEYLLENKPEIIKQVPSKYIASFINIRHETLSRIRAKV